MLTRPTALIVSLFVALALAACGDNKAPSAMADETVFYPSDKTYPREPQIVQGAQSRPELDFIAISWSTVAEAAQVYADFSRKEVRVPQSLLDRTLNSTRGTGKVAAGYIVTALAGQLRHDGVEIETLDRGAVRLVAGRTPAEIAAAKQPPPATASEVEAARAAMTDDRFWTLIDRARRGRDCFRTAAALAQALRALSPQEILGFHVRFEERMQESYRWDLWGVAYLVNGGASDDGFTYFRAWLISQGREYYTAALNTPERAADRAREPHDNECEEVLYSAIQAYEAKAGRPLPMIPLNYAPQPGGNPWKEEDLPRLYPELAKKFR